MNEDRLLTAVEVAELLAVPERWVREHTRSGLIPHVKLGRYIRYRREGVIAWIDGQQQCDVEWRRRRPEDRELVGNASKVERPKTLAQR